VDSSTTFSLSTPLTTKIECFFNQSSPLTSPDSHNNAFLNLAGVCSDVAILTSAWESNIALRLMSYDPIVASWISFAQNAALGSHTYILEDGPWLIAVSGPHANEGGEIIERMYARGRASMDDSGIRGRSVGSGGLDTGLGVGSTPSALAMSTHRQDLPTLLLAYMSRASVGLGVASNPSGA
jgi:hypothetical protein